MVLNDMQKAKRMKGVEILSLYYIIVSALIGFESSLTILACTVNFIFQGNKLQQVSLTLAFFMI